MKLLHRKIYSFSFSIVYSVQSITALAIANMHQLPLNRHTLNSEQLYTLLLQLLADQIHYRIAVFIGGQQI